MPSPYRLLGISASLKMYRCENFAPRQCVEKSEHLAIFGTEPVTEFFNCETLVTWCRKRT